MDTRIRRYREVLGYLTRKEYIEEKSVPLVDEEGVTVEDFSYVRQVDTSLPYLGQHVNILVGDRGIILIKHDIPSEESR